eukprot:1709163-Amphidinium_carterae.2
MIIQQVLAPRREHEPHLVVEMSDAPSFWPARVKRTFLKNASGECRCKVCNVYATDLYALVGHCTSQHLNNDTHTHVAMQIGNGA